MTKDQIRIQIVRPEEVDESLVYMPLVSAKGPGMGLLQVLDETDNTWYSVAIVATHSNRIITNEN